MSNKWPPWTCGLIHTVMLSSSPMVNLLGCTHPSENRGGKKLSLINYPAKVWWIQSTFSKIKNKLINIAGEDKYPKHSPLKSLPYWRPLLGCLTMENTMFISSGITSYQTNCWRGQPTFQAWILKGSRPASEIFHPVEVSPLALSA